MTSQEIVLKLFTDCYNRLGYIGTPVLEHPSDLNHGDWSCNAAMQLARGLGLSPQTLAQGIVDDIMSVGLPAEVDRLEIAGPGFINIYLSRDFFQKSLSQSEQAAQILAGQRIMVEYTDPNPFKVFHIGHLMTNTIGECIALLAETLGASVVRANYQGDIGPHVAKCLWAMQQKIDQLPSESDTVSVRTAFLGQCYSYGSTQYDENEQVKNEINTINTSLYTGSATQLIQRLYEQGKRWSMAGFDVIYEKLGSDFDVFYGESETFSEGMKIVKSNMEVVFSESDGAIVYAGERVGLHTRVFITSQGNPTYEAKDLGLAVRKFREYPDLDLSVYITANEQNDYFRVMFSALCDIHPEFQQKLFHIGHGMMQGPGGKKLASRKGTAFTGESVISDTEDLVREKMDNTEHNTLDSTSITKIAVAAIKFAILKQAIGKNIVFDFDTLLSLEGDSGAYLLYTYVRMGSLLTKAGEKNLALEVNMPSDWSVTDLEKMLYRAPEIIERSWSEKSPQLIITYALQIAGLYNSWYANTKIIDETDMPATVYKLAITEKTRTTLKQLLRCLGIRTVERM